MDPVLITCNTQPTHDYITTMPHLSPTMYMRSVLKVHCVSMLSRILMNDNDVLVIGNCPYRSEGYIPSNYVKKMGLDSEE